MQRKSKGFNKFLSLVAVSTLAVSSSAYLTPNVASANAITAPEEVAPNVLTSLTSNITKLESFYSDEYNKQFRVSPADIINISTNGGSYTNAGTENLIDDNTNTHWVSEIENSDNFTSHLIFTLKEPTTLNRVLFTPRIKGVMVSDFTNKFEIYASTEESGDNFSLVTSGSIESKITDKIEINFKPTEFKRLKFVFKEALFDLASASEFMLYKEDNIIKNVQSIFTDKTNSKVAPAYDSLDALNALEQTIEGHPYYDDLKADIDVAKKIVNDEVDLVSTLITAEQVGDRRASIRSNLQTDIGSNLQPTGFAALAGQTITVYVEANGSENLPTLTFTQQEGAWSNWKQSVQLKEGKNVLKVPSIPHDNNYFKTVTKGGPIYISNPYTPEQQNGAPVIRIEGAEKFPLMTKDTSPQDFKNEVNAYMNKLTKDKQENPNVANRKLIDVVEIMSDHVILTGTTTSAFKSFVISGRNPLDIINGYDGWMEKIFKFHGMDGSSEKHDPTLIRENIRLMQPLGYMYAYYDHTGINGMQDMLLMLDQRTFYTGWGLNHEIGHRIENPNREFLEVTNNMTAMLMSIEYNQMDTRIPFDNLYKYVIKENATTMSSRALFERLGAFWQIELAHPGYWTKMERLYREKKIVAQTDMEKQQQLIRVSSEAVGKDLSSHFARHGFSVSNETRAITSQYGKSDKIWYLNNSVVGYTGNGFADGTTVDVNISKTADKNKLTFAVNEDSATDLLGYEIVRDGEVIAFTRSNSFEDKTIDSTKEHTYTVVAYDKKLEVVSNTVSASVSAEE